MLASKTGILVIISILLLSACQGEPQLQGAIVPTRMATSTTAPSATPTLTPTPTLTSTPTLTPTATITPTPLPPSVEIGSVFTYETTGAITSSDWRFRYVFTAEAGDSVSVEMKTDSTRFDPLLILEDEAGTRLIENDDASDGSDNAAILNYVIEADGTYVIIASRRGEEDSPYIGDYQLSYLRLPSSYYDPTAGISLRPIELNQVFNDEISDSTFYVAYIFTGNTGDVLSIEMTATSGNLDAYLILVNRRTRAIIAENDDDERSSTTNAFINSVSLPENGEYIILASRYQGADGQSTGEFTLEVSKSE